MFYKDFFQQIRDILKDTDTEASASVPPAELGRAIRKGVVKLQTIFPEARLDRRGSLKKLETTAYTDTTANVEVGGEYPKIPISEEFEPALEAYTMMFVFARDSNDEKDESLLKYWTKRFTELVGPDGS